MQFVESENTNKNTNFNVKELVSFDTPESEV
jgi:hypothetical protein